MVSKLELDKALAIYEKNYDYLSRLEDLIDLMYKDPIFGRYEVTELVQNDNKKITDLISTLNVINKAYRDGNTTTKKYIEQKLYQVSSTLYLPEQISQIRVIRDDLTNLLNDENIQYVPPIPRKAKRPAPKNGARTTTTKPAAKKPAVRKSATNKPAVKKSVTGQFKKITGIRF